MKKTDPYEGNTSFRVQTEAVTQILTYTLTDHILVSEWGIKFDQMLFQR
jgi:hypothetical protein